MTTFGPREENSSLLPCSWHKGHKYYNIHIQPTLFGGTSLIKTWGAKGSKRAGYKIVYCSSEEEASAAISDTVKRRKLRGYRPYDRNGIKTPTKELLELVAKQKGNGSINRLKQLIQSDADINTHDHEGYSALHRAAYLKNTDIVTALITSGAEVNIRCDKGGTPLMESSWKGDIETVKLLLKYGADVNIRSNKLHTALTVAILGNHPEIVRLLLKAKADINVKDNEGRTIQEYALDSRNNEIIELIIGNPELSNNSAC